MLYTSGIAHAIYLAMVRKMFLCTCHLCLTAEKQMIQLHEKKCAKLHSAVNRGVHLQELTRGLGNIFN